MDLITCNRGFISHVCEKVAVTFFIFLIPWWKQVLTRNLAKSKPFVMVSAFTDTVVTCSSHMSAFIVSEASVFSNSKWILMERKKKQTNL